MIRDWISLPSAAAIVAIIAGAADPVAKEGGGAEAAPPSPRPPEGEPRNGCRLGDGAPPLCIRGLGIGTKPDEKAREPSAKCWGKGEDDEDPAEERTRAAAEEDKAEAKLKPEEGADRRETADGTRRGTWLLPTVLRSEGAGLVEE